MLALRSSGGLVMATKEGFAFWEPHTQALRFIVDPEAEKPSTRFNDGAVDCQGRFWAGTMCEIPELYITSAWTALSEEQRKKQPYAGDLFRVKTGIKGLEQPKFGEPHSR